MALKPLLKVACLNGKTALKYKLSTNPREMALPWLSSIHSWDSEILTKLISIYGLQKKVEIVEF